MNFRNATLVTLVIGWVALGRGRRGARPTIEFLGSTVHNTILSTAAVFLLLIGVTLLTRLLTVSRLTTSLTEWITGFDLSAWQFLLLLALLYLVLGMFLDPIAMILLTVPGLYEPLQTFDINMIWFGVFLVVLCEIGQVSPPVGILSFVVHRISQNPSANLGHEIRLTTVFRGVLWFIATALLFLVILVLFPEIVLWLPEVSGA